MIPTISTITNSYKILSRYKEIISLVVSYGFGDLIEKTNLQRILFKGTNLFSNKPKVEIENLGTYRRFRLLLEELGPVFVKLGQILSQRIDILPKELIEELVLLQDNVQEIPFEEIEIQLISEVKKNLSEIFLEFNTTPVASASIAQVYRAKLHSGEYVAVKIQRPTIEEIITVDSEIMTHLASILERNINYFATMDLGAVVKGFKKNLRDESNFYIEASHIKRFYQSFKKFEGIKVPKIYEEFSTEKVLVMEYIEGKHIDSIIAECNNEGQRKKIASVGFSSIFKQIFIDGFFHGDPHPGNLLIMEDSSICFLDYGSMGTVLPSQKKQLRKMIFAFSARDSRKIVHSLIDITGNNELLQNKKLINDIEHIIEKYYWMDIHHIKIAELFEDFNIIVSKYKISIPPNFFLLFKSLILFDGIARALDPTFNVLKTIEKEIKEMIFSSLIPKNIIRELYFNVSDFTSFVKNFPIEIVSLLEQLKMGQIKIEFEHVGLDRLSKSLNNTVNKLISAVILGSLIIGSSIIIHSKVPPVYHEIPIIGIITFVIAAFWAFILLIFIIRQK